MRIESKWKHSAQYPHCIRSFRVNDIDPVGLIDAELEQRRVRINVHVWLRSFHFGCGALPFENEMITRARTLYIGSLKLKVATPEDLIIMKAIARRPKDIADIEAILNIEQNLDFGRIRFWVGQFADVLEMPELMEDLEKILGRQRA